MWCFAYVYGAIDDTKRFIDALAQYDSSWACVRRASWACVRRAHPENHLEREVTAVNTWCRRTPQGHSLGVRHGAHQAPGTQQ